MAGRPNLLSANLLQLSAFSQGSDSPKSYFRFLFRSKVRRREIPISVFLPFSFYNITFFQMYGLLAHSTLKGLPPVALDHRICPSRFTPAAFRDPSLPTRQWVIVPRPVSDFRYVHGYPHPHRSEVTTDAAAALHPEFRLSSLDPPSFVKNRVTSLRMRLLH